MGYRKIPNLYKSREILLFKEVFALEKIHGTSAHVTYKNDKVSVFSGGMKHDVLLASLERDLPNGLPGLLESFRNLGYGAGVVVTVYGEAYGGKMQGMSATYGKESKFVAFEVCIGDQWLDVLTAHKVATRIGFDFVHFEKGPATQEFLDSQRDAPSVQAAKNGISGEHIREGIVVRPPLEFCINGTERVLVKHKRPEFSEHKVPKTLDSVKEARISDAKKIAEDWVVPMRLEHVLDALKSSGNMVEETMFDMKNTKQVIDAMILDIISESSGEIDWTEEVSGWVSKATAKLWKALVLSKNSEKDVE